LPKCERAGYTPRNRRRIFTTEGTEITEKRKEEIGMGFVRAAKTSDVPAGTIREFDVEGKAVALANVDGQFYAINNVCLHRGGPLADGPIEGSVVTCPWHGWQYDVRTGKVGQNPTVGVESYPVEVRGEEIFVNVSG
jgi:nitrite reductase/ring-hydroxylating ferredoxin subunit